MPLGFRFPFALPFALNPVPVTLTVEIDTFAVPASVSVIDLVTGLPTVTFPNATLVALAVSCEVGAVTPVTNPIVTPMCNAMFALKAKALNLGIDATGVT